MQTLKKSQVDEKIATNDNAVLINVLGKEYFESERIPGSVNIPHEAPDFLDRVKKLVKSQGEEIIVYCANLQCAASTKAAEKLEKAGYKKVYDFKGGVAEWKEKGGKVEGKGGMTKGKSEKSGDCGTSSCS